MVKHDGVTGVREHLDAHAAHEYQQVLLAGGSDVKDRGTARQLDPVRRIQYARSDLVTGACKLGKQRLNGVGFGTHAVKSCHNRRGPQLRASSRP